MIIIVAFNFAAGVDFARHARLSRDFQVAYDMRTLQQYMVGTEGAICLMSRSWMMGPGWRDCKLQDVLSFIRSRRATMWGEYHL